MCAQTIRAGQKCAKGYPVLTECAIISFNRFYALDFDRVSDPLFPPLTCILREVAIAYGKTTETGIRPTRGTGCGRDRQRSEERL